MSLRWPLISFGIWAAFVGAQCAAHAIGDITAAWAVQAAAVLLWGVAEGRAWLALVPDRAQAAWVLPGIFIDVGIGLWALLATAGWLFGPPLLPIEPVSWDGFARAMLMFGLPAAVIAGLLWRHLPTPSEGDSDDPA